jgi:hypothetical protein
MSVGRDGPLLVAHNSGKFQSRSGMIDHTNLHQILYITRDEFFKCKAVSLAWFESSMSHENYIA